MSELNPFDRDPPISDRTLEPTPHASSTRAEELGELTSHLQDCIAASDLATFFIDSEFRMLWFTPKAAELFDLGQDQHRALLSEGPHELNYKRLRQDAEAVLGTLKPVEREIEDGHNRCYLMRALPCGNKATSNRGVVFTFVDITHRKEAEEALRTSAQRFRALIAASSDVLFRMSPSAEEMRQLNGGGFLTDTTTPLTSWLDAYIPEEDQSRVMAAVRQAVASKSVFELEHRVRRADGTNGWALTRAVPVLDHQGEVIEWFGSGTDITEQKSGEEASRWLSAIIQTSPHGIISKSLDGIITSWNPGAERIFGYTEAEAVGQPITMIIPPEHREQGRQILQRLRAGEVIEKLETTRLRKDGSRVQVSLTISPLAQSTLTRRAAGDVQATPRAVEFVEDITRSRQIAEALRRSENELRALAGSLLSAQEDERRRIARDLHDDVTQDLALIAIELGKLAANSGEVDARNLTLRALQARVTEVSQAVRHLSHGLHPSMLEDFGLAAALEVFCEEFGSVEGMPVDFQSDADESGLTASAAACLYRVAQEAIRNAWKHAHASHVRVELSHDGGQIRLAIRDDGIGIGSARAGRLECGLGLVSMKERVRLLHGELVVQSSPGRGTDIIATVPAQPFGGGVSEDCAG